VNNPNQKRLHRETTPYVPSGESRDRVEGKPPGVTPGESD